MRLATGSALWLALLLVAYWWAAGGGIRDLGAPPGSRCSRGCATWTGCSAATADSVVSRLGRGELEPADCPREVTEVLALAEEARRASRGAFDVRRPGVGLDTDGAVKRWAVQRAARALDDLEETDFCLSGDGELACVVRDPNGDPWRIGIEDPRDPTRVLAVVPVHTGAVATSGAAHRGQHIGHGATADLPAGVASVTVVAADLTWADIDATAAYAVGRGALDWLRTRPARSGLVVWADGTSESFATGLRPRP